MRSHWVPDVGGTVVQGLRAASLSVGIPDTPKAKEYIRP